MRKPFRRIFQTNPEKLEEMLQLRREGKSLSWLAAYYNCDHTSILHLCRKFGVKPEVKVVYGRPRKNGYKWNNKKLIMKVLESEEEKINSGTDYATYLERYLEREERKRKNKDTPAQVFAGTH